MVRTALVALVLSFLFLSCSSLSSQALMDGDAPETTSDFDVVANGSG